MKRRSIFIISFVLVVGLFLQGCSSSSDQASGNGSNQQATDFPNRDITIVVGWGAGGGTDSFSRAIAKPLSEILGVNVNVVNKTGGNGQVAANYVLSQPSNGYTLWAMTSIFPINIASGRAQTDLSDFAPIARVQNDTLSIQVKNGSKYTDIDEFIQDAKKHPGEITIGGNGATGIYSLNVRRFEKEAGIDLDYIPYSDAGQMHADLLGGHLDAQLEEPGPNISLIKKGKIDISLIFAEKAIDRWPDVPTTVEKGWELTDGMSRGLMVKAGTPKKVREKLEQAVQKAMESTSYKTYAQQALLDLKPGWLNSEQFGEYLNKSVKNYNKIMKQMENSK